MGRAVARSPNHFCGGGRHGLLGPLPGSVARPPPLFGGGDPQVLWPPARVSIGGPPPIRPPARSPATSTVAGWVRGAELASSETARARFHTPRSLWSR